MMKYDKNQLFMMDCRKNRKLSTTYPQFVDIFMLIEFCG